MKKENAKICLLTSPEFMEAINQGPGKFAIPHANEKLANIIRTMRECLKECVIRIPEHVEQFGKLLKVTDGEEDLLLSAAVDEKGFRDAVDLVDNRVEQFHELCEKYGARMAEEGERDSYSILAVEGETDTAIAFTFEAIRPTELYTAVKSAAKEFLSTEDGQKVLDQTCGSFNWGDFVESVPDSICLRHGFLLKGYQKIERFVALNEQLNED